MDLPSAQRSQRPLQPVQFRLLGDLGFSPNKSAAKSLLAYLSTRSAVEQLVAGSHGYDIPPFEKLRNFDTWAEEAPPKGTLYNYPPRGDVISSLSGYPAPVNIGNQMFVQGTVCDMVARCTQQGQSIDRAIAAAADEIEGFMRT
jgi:hypothetical protein